MADDGADDRWTVRGVSKAYRERAAEAASRRKISLGALVCEGLDLAHAAEREPLDLTVRQPADKASDTSASLSDTRADLALVERAVAAAVALAAEPNVPAAFRRRANRLLREALPASAPRPAVGKPRLTLAGGTEA